MTNIPCSNHRPEHVEADLDASLKDLQVDYVDSFVIHWAMACPSTGKNPTLRTNGIYPAHKSKSKILTPKVMVFCFDSDLQSN